VKPAHRAGSWKRRPAVPVTKSHETCSVSCPPRRSSKPFGRNVW